MNQHNQHLPAIPDTLFAEACQLHHNGQLQEALLLYEQLLEEVPDSSLLLYNIGLIMQELGDFSAAISSYNKAVRLSPHDVDILYNLALCYQKNKNRKKALALYKKAHEYSPTDLDILYNMGCCYQQLDNEEQAITTYEALLKLEGNHLSTLNNLAYLYQKNNHEDEAVLLYKHLLQLQPKHQGASHMLVSLTGSTATNTPKQYIEEIFNHYSNHYETSLVDELGYDVPAKLRQLYDSRLHKYRQPLKGIDLGCGTGLSGLAFHDICTNLTGIDLSANMIEEATKKQIYDQLVVTDIIDFLKKQECSYDIIIAADVLTYMGELKEIFQVTYAVGSDNCIFCFSTEKTEEEGFRLGKTGRFQHSVDYLQTTALQVGWQPLFEVETDLRMERGMWIPGNLTFLSK